MAEGSSEGAIPTTPLVSRVRTRPHTLISSSLTGSATVKVWQRLPHWSCQAVLTAPGQESFQLSMVCVRPESGVMRRY
jgi:hypothetical protein